MRALRRAVGGTVFAAMLLAGVLALWASVRGRPQDWPWAPLDLAAPPGLFTGRKLAALRDQPGLCRRLLHQAGVRFVALPPVHAGLCGYADGIRLLDGGARRIGLAPAGVATACPVAAALAMWEWNTLQPAAERRFGARVTRIEHFGSYNCRRMYGRETGSWSEHATADAIDVAGFRLSNGMRITVARDWRRAGDKAAFLHEVRDGACDLFATTLSPDYNAAHRDHLHLDQAARGAWGWRACR